MNYSPLNLLLADDDTDDCLFFKDALEELPLSATLTTVNDGVELMQHLTTNQDSLPGVIYLDLNMPRKNGFDSLSEIKSNEKLRHLPVIIYSTSFNKEVADKLYEMGASYYIRKPAEFSIIKAVILESITLISENKSGQPSKEKLLISNS